MRQLVFLLFFICWIPLIYYVMNHESLYMNNTLSYFIGDKQYRYYYFTFYFVIISFFMTLHQLLVFKKVDFHIFLVLISTLLLLWIPEQDDLYTHVFFSLIGFINVLLYMIYNSLNSNRLTLKILTLLNILLFIYICLFFRTQSVVNEELFFIVCFLSFYGILNRKYV